MMLLLLCLLLSLAGTAARADPGGRDLRHDWRLALQALQTRSEADKIEAVNRQVNRQLHFSEDRTLWRQGDYWATPEETLQRGRGDCEDYAILKYFSLRALGIAPDRLWLVFTRLRVGGEHGGITLPHMVLAYYPAPGSEPLILDNLVTTLYPASRRRDLEPVFSFNQETLRIGRTRYPAARLPQWQAVLQRMAPQQVPR